MYGKKSKGKLTAKQKTLPKNLQAKIIYETVLNFKTTDSDYT